MSKKAFTLAEVLITLSILGVVAAMTIPNVVFNYKEKANIVKLKKVYSQLQNAFDMAEAIYGDSKNWELAACDGKLVRNSIHQEYNFPNNFYCQGGTKYRFKGNGFTTILAEFLPLAKECSTNGKYIANDGCSNSISYNQYNNRYLLKDGTFIQNNPNEAYQTFTYEGKSTNLLGALTVDINGDKNPNTSGMDKFNFYITDGGIVPQGGSSNQSYASYGNYYSHNLCNYYKGKTASCTRWAIEKGNMDYLRKTTNW